MPIYEIDIEVDPGAWHTRGWILHVEAPDARRAFARAMSKLWTSEWGGDGREVVIQIRKTDLTELPSESHKRQDEMLKKVLDQMRQGAKGSIGQRVRDQLKEGGEE
ncbi:MAG: hypothetical protein ABIJ57_00490 [Pseudomonadota bacterium]